MSDHEVLEDEPSFAQFSNRQLRTDVQLEQVQADDAETLNEIILTVTTWASSCQLLERLLTHLIYYFILQIALTCLEIGEKWHDPQLYVYFVFVQYTAHIAISQLMRVKAQKRSAQFQELIAIQRNTRIGMMEFVSRYLVLRAELSPYEHSTNFGKIWSVVSKGHPTLILLNNLSVIWMWLYGNFQLFRTYNKVDDWFLVAQLCFGWSIAAFIALIGTLVLIIVPIGYCYVAMKSRWQKRRRQQNLERIKNRKRLYSSISNPGSQPCYICLEEYGPDDLVVPLSCQNPHLFHLDCLVPWLERNELCPVCRHPVS